MNKKVQTSKSSSIKPSILQGKWEEYFISNYELGGVMEEVIRKNVSFRFVAKGCSMLPFIKEGDILTLKPTNVSKLLLGNIVAFRNEETGKLLIHRIIAISGNSFLIKADNSNSVDDGWVSKNAIIGILSQVKRNEKKIRFGLGIERVLIALLSRWGLLTRIVRRAGLLKS